jgi:PAS domain S-box-containing protein
LGKSTDDLLLEIEKLKKINIALMNRVEQSVATQGSAFSLFEGNIILRKKVEEKEAELEEAKINLLKQKRSLDAAVLISETDLRGKLTYVNSLFCATTGYVRDELVGQPHKIVSSGKHSKDFWVSFWRLLKKGKVFKGEICNKAKDGSHFWVDSTVFPLFDLDYTIKGFTSVSIDITGKKEKEKRYIHQAKLASIGELAAGVGHEINNPLAICIGNLNLIERELIKENYQNLNVLEKIKKIRTASNRIKKITDGLRIYSRLDAEASEISSLGDIVSQTLDLVSDIYEKEGVEISLEFSHRLNSFLVKGDSGKLQQVLMNLVSNAKDATDGQKSRTLAVKVLKSEGRVSVSVKDNGHGIPDSIRSKILDPFFTTKKSGKGTGLGLGLVREVIESLGGKLEIESSVGTGSCFTIILDLYIGPGETSLTKNDMLPTRENENYLDGRILIVDDEDGIRELLADYLENLGLTVEEAGSGEAALKLLDNRKYDYICTDLKMPKMCGDEFIKRAKDITNTNTRYIIMSGGVINSDGKGLCEQVQNLADGFIIKPFSEKSIFDVISKIKKK